MGKSKLSLIENWKEYRASFQEEAEKIVSGLTLAEKVSLMSGRLTREEIRSQILNKKKTHYNETPYWAGGFAKENVMPILFVDGSRGVVCGRGIYTGFPVEVLRGAAFDRDLERRIGFAIAEEVLSAGGNLFGGVCLNLPYHPGWGRSQESYGEDSFLTGELGAAMVQGVQKLGVIACIKHFAFNSMENNRLNVNIICDKRTEQEVFLPQFRKCIDAGAGAVMTAYNSYNGEMCGENHYLIREVLKGKWGFDGFVLSDFTWGIKDTVASAEAGMDIEMPHTYYYGSALKKAVDQGKVRESLIDESAIRIVRTMLAHGDYMLKAKEYYNIRREKIWEEHTRLALQCAREGITLLENREHVLPLSCGGKGKKIVLLGTLAEEDNQGDHGSSKTYPPYVVHATEGIWSMLSGAELIVYSGESKSHCRRLAKEADAIIIFAGNSFREEGEHIKADENVLEAERYGGDRIENLGLLPQHVSMVDAVSEIRKDAILVLTGGSAILVEDVREKVGAILMQFYPGMEGGTALGEILFGKVCPSGRLPFSVPKKTEDLVPIDWYADEQQYGRYHGYTQLDHIGAEPRYPFGHGLSYTEFQVSDVRCRISGGNLQVDAAVENIGKRDADRVILMFVHFPSTEVEREKRLLRGFQRIHVPAGDKKQVSMQCALKELMYYDERKDKMVLEKGMYQVSVEGNMVSFQID